MIDFEFDYFLGRGFIKLCDMQVLMKSERIEDTNKARIDRIPFQNVASSMVTRNYDIWNKNNF